MRLFKWNAAHAVYLPEIDAEHRAIFQAASELQRTIVGSASSERVLEVLRALIAHIEEHFAHEERLMEETNYLSRAWHRQQHDSARKRLKGFLAGITESDTEQAALLLEFLAGWMRDHVTVADRMMGAHLRNHKRSHAAA